MTLQKKRFLNAGRVGRDNNTEAFSKRCWPRLVKQHQGLEGKTAAWQRGRKHTSIRAGDADEAAGCTEPRREAAEERGLLRQWFSLQHNHMIRSW